MLTKLIFALLFILSTKVNSRVIYGIHMASDICDWDLRCRARPGWFGWCDGKWDQNCCFREKQPDVDESCVQVDTCKYICCNWPTHPCGNDCCMPNQGDFLNAGIVPRNKTNLKFLLEEKK